MSRWRLLDTGALPATMNMAIDEALVHLHARGESPPTLRFYQWDPPAISLGYFQRRHQINFARCRELGLEVVRRLTGGRAVMHQGDLTYSVIAGAQEGMPAFVKTAYGLLCAGLLSGFRLLGIEAELGHEPAGSTQPDVCFLLSTGGDIVYQGRKFVGSAQTRLASSLLQHGSIVLEPQVETWLDLLGANNESRELLARRLRAHTTSLNEMLGRRIEAHKVKLAIKEGMAQALGVVFEAGELSRQEWALAHEMAGRRGADKEPLPPTMVAPTPYRGGAELIEKATSEWKG
jgi:lipoyl(octanoyl) transferase